MNRIAILTGSSGGIGSKILKRLMRTDIKCCCLVRNPQYNSGYTAIHADLSEADAVYLQQLNQWIEKHASCSEIILILAAAVINPIEAVGKMGNVLQKNINTNVLSQVRLVDNVINMADKFDLPVRIIQFDSGAAYRPIGGWALYCASKAYMSMYLKVLASERMHCKIVLFDPGVVDTGMQQNIRDADLDAFKDRPVFEEYKRAGKLNGPDEVADFVVRHYIKSWDTEALTEKYRIEDQEGK